MSKKVWIIDPSSVEENRGSFCYAPYLLTSALRPNYDVTFFEDFTITEKDKLDDISPKDLVYVSLWSYPQIELCRILSARIPQAKFFGYTPLIVEEKLPVFILPESMIKNGIRYYAGSAPSFKHLLLSDCDGHLKGLPEVYPLFGNHYGCSRGCSFCPVTPNLPEKRAFEIPYAYTIHSLEAFQKMNPGSGVHFTDEDFFRNTERAKSILRENRRICDRFEVEPSVIALGSVTSFNQFLDSFNGTGEDAVTFCDHTGLKLVEIGLETADENLARTMGKPSVMSSESLAERVSHMSTKILWLTLTLSPGETISSIGKTGSFLKKYGLDPKEMSPRIVTNGTMGGLGQYFQKYPGTRDYETLDTKGLSLSPRPTRLIPSFIPFSLLFDTIQQINPKTDEYYWWLKRYGAPDLNFICDEQIAIKNMLDMVYQPYWKSIITVCVAARLGVIE